MGNRTFNIQTFGCQMNEHDSETLAGILKELGYRENKERKDADIIIINTCSVRENADKRFFGTLGQFKNVKKERPNIVVAVCGCMMQQQHIIDILKSKYPWVDLVFGTHNIHEFPILLKDVLKERKRIISVWEDADKIVEGLPVDRKYRFKAYVNITYGCNNFCTYCIVPYTRGRELSRDPEQVIKEVKELVADGVKEITLLGQNVNSYKGQSSITNTVFDFPELIYELDKIRGLERIRFMTSHPKDLSDRLIQTYVDCSKLCRHIHLPVQSGSTDVLRRMNRKYTREEYLSLIYKLKKAVPEMSITTDIIVGFPGETEKDFQNTLELIEKVRYDSAFTFLYSIRKGTPAGEFSDQISEDIKHERFNRLVKTVNRISKEKNHMLVGSKEKVLVEGQSKTNLKALSGRTEGHKLVNFEGGIDLIGNIVDVRIIDSTTFSLVGKLE